MLDRPEQGLERRLRRLRSARVRLEAAKWLHGEHMPGGGATVNVGVQVVTPGYVLDLREDEESLARDDAARMQMRRLDVHGAKPLADKGDVQDA